MHKQLTRIAAFIVGMTLSVAGICGLETVTHISDLNSSWPLGSDLASTSDDHIRNIKVALKTDFPNVNAAVTPTPTQFNQLTTDTFTTAVTAPAFIPNSSTVPSNGIYLPSANTLGFSNSTSQTGTLTATMLTMPGIALTGATIPANGVYLPAANKVGLSTNSTQRGTIDSAGAWIINQPTSGVPLTVNGAAGYAQKWSDGTETGGIFLSASSPNVQFGSFTNHNIGFFVNNGSPLMVIGASNAIQGLGPVAAVMVDMTPDTGTFTATMTGGTTSPTCTARWTRVGNLVMLELCSATATSNATTFTYTGLPAAVQPTVGQNVPMAIALDNGAAVPLITAQLAAASGTITFFKSASSTGWTNVGSKGLNVVNTISYLLN